MQHDYMRCLKHKLFLLMESSPSSLNWHGVSKLKRPGLLTASGLQAIAHGSDSVLYFQIRQSRGASEKFHGAVIDHYGGNDTRVFREVKAIGEALGRLEEIKGSVVKADAAVIYDVESRWAMEGAQGPRNEGLFYHEAAMVLEKGWPATLQQMQSRNFMMIFMGSWFAGQNFIRLPGERFLKGWNCHPGGQESGSMCLCRISVIKRRIFGA